jgi:hypothetical protein
MGYKGEISKLPNDEFPLLVTVKDDAGNFFGTFPARNPEEAQERLTEVLEKLRLTEARKT